MHILVAPNAFKNSLSAEAAAASISRGLRQSKLSCTCRCFPVGDGGDGTARLLAGYLGGEEVKSEVQGPLHQRTVATFWLADDRQTALIDLSEASGLHLLQLNQYDPLKTSTYGTGELIRLALQRGVRKIILAVGGSATVDGGVGALVALGAQLLDSKNCSLLHLPSELPRLSTIDLTRLDHRLDEVELIVLCDVDNYLLGASGAASIYGPQKGASQLQVQQLESGLQRLQEVALSITGKDMNEVKGGGAAGGAAAGFATLMGGRVVSGSEYFLDASGFDQELSRAQIVITGEGSLDSQTLRGKAPWAIAKRAKKKSLPVLAVAGVVPLVEDTELRNLFDVMLAIGHGPMEVSRSMELCNLNLERIGREIGNFLALADY